MAAGDIKLVYAASVAVTITLGSLASDATFLAGRESTEISNTVNLFLDYLLAGKISVGTSPTTSKEIRVYVAGLIDDTTYPDVFDGLDSAETITDIGIRAASLRLAASIQTSSISNQIYYFGPVSVAALFGGTLTKKFVVFVTHNTGVALHGTESIHKLSVTGVFENVAG